MGCCGGGGCCCWTLGGAAGASVPSPFCLTAVGGSEGPVTEAAVAPSDPPLVLRAVLDNKLTWDG